MKKLGDLLRERTHYISLGADESDGPRCTNNYMVTIDVTLIPKAIEGLNVKMFHLSLVFPEVCQCHVPMCIDEFFSGGEQRYFE